jgi:hypothetical protein
MKTSGLLLFCAAILAAPAATAGLFIDDFNQGINSAHWSKVFTTPGLHTIDDSQGDVRMAKNQAVRSPGGFQNARLVLNPSVYGGNIPGDFSARVQFDDAVLTSQTFSQVELIAIFASGAVFNTTFDNFGGPGIGLNVHVWDGSNIRGAIPMPAGTDSGELRIERVGTQVTGYFGDQAIFTNTRSAPLTALWFTLHNNHNNANISVTFDNFSLSAASVPEPATGGLVASLAALGLCRRRA